MKYLVILTVGLVVAVAGGRVVSSGLKSVVEDAHAQQNAKIDRVLNTR